jgi:hypothetical protein
MATKYARAAGGNWSANATWSTTSGGGADTTKPVAGDTAILDANSGQVTIDVDSACAILYMWTAGAGEYANTLTFNANLTTTGAVDLGGTIAGASGYLKPTATSTLTSHGHTFTGQMWFGGTSQTYTIADAWTVNGNFQTDGVATGATLTLNGLLTIGGELILQNSNITFNGTNGFSTNNLVVNPLTADKTYSLKESVTYTVRGDLYSLSNTTYRGVFISGHASTKTKLTLNYTAGQNGGYTNFTRVDASEGQAIFTKGSITDCFNITSTLLSGTIVGATGGETVAIAGITKDNDGNALGSCDCFLFRSNGNALTPTYLQYQLSDPTTGAYSFSCYPGSTYFVVAFKAGATPVMDVTDRTLTAV